MSIDVWSIFGNKHSVTHRLRHSNIPYIFPGCQIDSDKREKGIEVN